MSIVRAEIVRVTGRCNAQLEVGDTFVLRGLDITPQGNAKACQVAFASIVQNAGRLKLQGSPIYVACPDPGTGEGGNVILRLSLEEDHELDKY